MANMEERLQAVVSQAETDGAKWHIGHFFYKSLW